MYLEFNNIRGIRNSNGKLLFRVTEPQLVQRLRQEQAMLVAEGVEVRWHDLASDEIKVIIDDVEPLCDDNNRLTHYQITNDDTHYWTIICNMVTRRFQQPIGHRQHSVLVAEAITGSTEAR